MNINDELSGIVADAAVIITANLDDEDRIGEIVQLAVSAAGGSAADEFLVTEMLTKAIPVGARRLRKSHRLYLNAKRVEEAAVAIFADLVGDPDASMVDIGKWVDRVVRNMRGATAIDAVKPLVVRLNSVGAETSPAFMLRCRSAFQVATLGGVELTKFIPAQYPATALPCLSRLTKGRMPWVAKDLVLKAAKRIVQRQPQGKRQIEKIVANVIAKEARKAPKAPAVFVRWYMPPKPGRGLDGSLPSRIHKAA